MESRHRFRTGDNATSNGGLERVYKEGARGRYRSLTDVEHMEGLNCIEEENCIARLYSFAAALGKILISPKCVAGCSGSGDKYFGCFGTSSNSQD